MKHCFLLAFLMVAIASSAQTITAEGPQTGVWDADTVLVTGDVTVVDTLIINAGTTVLFNGFYGITINSGASLLAQGNADDSIVFTVPDTLGFHVYNSPKGGWNGLLLNKADKVQLDYCRLEYGKASDTLDQRGGAMEVIMSQDVVVNNCSFSYNFARENGGAIHAIDSKLTFSGCTINDNKVYTGDFTYAMYGGGAHFLKCDVTMTDMQFLNNYGERTIGGALAVDSSAFIIDRAVFAYNIGINGGGFYVMRNNHKECRISNVLIHDNHAYHFAGGMAFADSSPEVYNVTVTRNSSEGVDCQGVFYYMHSAPKLTNCIVSDNHPFVDNYEGPTFDTVQQWIWTFDEVVPEFRNCLFEDGIGQFTGGALEYVTVFEDIIDADPCFVDPDLADFRLREDSPCRDTGSEQTPIELLESVDLDGRPRMKNGRIDLGPYEYSGYSVAESQSNTFARLYGHPLNAHSRLVVDLDTPADVMVRVLSMVGRTVVEESFGRQPAGTVELNLGKLASQINHGIYLMEIRTNSQTQTIKVIR